MSALSKFIDEYGGPGTATATSDFTESHVTDLVSDQDYIDLEFDSDKGGTGWKLEGLVENDTDPEESLLRLWITTVTLRSNTGARVWLNGAPDTDNYKLRWEVR